MCQSVLSLVAAVLGAPRHFTLGSRAVVRAGGSPPPALVLLWPPWRSRACLWAGHSINIRFAKFSHMTGHKLMMFAIRDVRHDIETAVFAALSMRLAGLVQAATAAVTEDEPEEVAGVDLQGSIKIIEDHLQQLEKRLVKQSLWQDGVILKPPVRKAVEADIHDAVEWLGVRIIEAQRDLSDANAIATRKQLKASKVQFDMKLATARSAANVEMRNSAAEMSAAHARAMESAVAELKAGGSQELEEAFEKIQHLEFELSKKSDRCLKAEETLAKTSALCEKSESRVNLLETKLGKKEKELERMEKQMEVPQRILQGHLVNLNLVKGDEKLPLVEQINKILHAHETTNAQTNIQVGDLTTEVVALRLERDDLANAVDELQNQMDEAASKAKQAALHASEECKRLTELLAAHLKDQNDARKGGLRGTPQQQLDRLLLELETLSNDMALLEEESHTSKVELTNVTRELEERTRAYDERDAKVKALEAEAAELGDEVQVLRAGTGGVDAELRDVKQKLGSLQAEHAGCHAQLTTVLEALNIKIDENKTLAEHIAELIASFEALKVANIGLTDDLAQTQKQAEEDLARVQAEAEAELASTKAKSAEEYASLKASSAEERGKLQAALEQEGASAAKRIAELEAEMAAQVAKWKAATELAETELATFKRVSEVELRDLRDECEREVERQTLGMKQELSECGATLGSLLSKAEVLQYSNKSLREQAIDLVNRFRLAEKEMERFKANSEEMRALVDEMMEEFEQQIGDVRREWRDERQRLVKASLKSLKHLRSHLVQTMELREEDLGRELSQWQEKHPTPVRGLTSLAKSMPSLNAKFKPAGGPARAPAPTFVIPAWQPHHSQRTFPSLKIGPVKERPRTAGPKADINSPVTLKEPQRTNQTTAAGGVLRPGTAGAAGASSRRVAQMLAVQPILKQDLITVVPVSSPQLSPSRSARPEVNESLRLQAYRTPVERRE